MNYPMIEKLNLDVTCDKHYGCFVHANDLEALLEKGQKVYGGHQGYKGTERVPLVWSTEDDGDNSHESIVIGIKEIKKEAEEPKLQDQINELSESDKKLVADIADIGRIFEKALTKMGML